MSGAASSGGAGASAVVATGTSSLAQEAEALSHRGRIFVDEGLDGEWCLTDTMTLEQRALPKTGGWELAVHPETGRAVAYSSDGEALVVVDDFTRKNLYKDKTRAGG